MYDLSLLLFIDLILELVSSSYYYHMVVYYIHGVQNKQSVPNCLIT